MTCSILSKVVLADGLTIVGQNMFKETDLLVVSVPSTVTFIGIINTNAFKYY